MLSSAKFNRLQCLSKPTRNYLRTQGFVVRKPRIWLNLADEEVRSPLKCWSCWEQVDLVLGPPRIEAATCLSCFQKRQPEVARMARLAEHFVIQELPV